MAYPTIRSALRMMSKGAPWATRSPLGSMDTSIGARNKHDTKPNPSLFAVKPAETCD